MIMKMDPILVFCFFALALCIQSLIFRRKLNKLGERIDAIADSLPEKDLDFFQSKRMKKYLSNTKYMEILCAKAERIKAAVLLAIPPKTQ